MNKMSPLNILHKKLHKYFINFISYVLTIFNVFKIIKRTSVHVLLFLFLPNQQCSKITLFYVELIIMTLELNQELKHILSYFKRGKFRKA